MYAQKTNPDVTGHDMQDIFCDMDRIDSENSGLIAEKFDQIDDPLKGVSRKSGTVSTRCFFLEP
jgi:hypothetical protein